MSTAGRLRRSFQRRKISRTRRFIRCLTTELPTFRLAVIPSRGWPARLGTKCSTASALCRRRPCRSHLWKSARRGSLSFRVRRSPESGEDLATDRASGRQALAPFAAAPGDDGAARAGAHAGPESVVLLPAAIVRLKGTLHGWCLFLSLGRPPSQRTSPGRSHMNRTRNPPGPTPLKTKTVIPRIFRQLPESAVGGRPGIRVTMAERVGFEPTDRLPGQRFS